MKPEEFINVLEDVTSKDNPEIDVTKQRTKLALHTILIHYYQSRNTKSPQMWQRVTSKKSKQESEKDFFDGLMKNHDLAAILIALYRDPHQSIEEFSKALKGKKDQNFPELLDLLTTERTLATHIKVWLNSEFTNLQKKVPPGVYYSILYHSALKHANADALDELLTLFPNKSQLEKLRDLKGNAFRQFYSDYSNKDFWRNFNLITSHYYDRGRILDLIAEKLFDSTDEKERAKIIAEIARSKNPFSKELESHLVQRLPKPNQEVRLVSTRGGAELPFAEFEVLCQSPERTPSVSAHSRHIPSQAPTGPSKR